MRLLGRLCGSELGRRSGAHPNGKRAVVSVGNRAREGSFYNMGGIAQHEPPQSSVSIVIGGTNQRGQVDWIRCERAFCSISWHVIWQCISVKSARVADRMTLAVDGGDNEISLVQIDA